MIRANFEILGREFNIECGINKDYIIKVEKALHRSFKFEDFEKFIEENGVENFKLYWNDYRIYLDYERAFIFADFIKKYKIEDIKDLAQHIYISEVIKTNYYDFSDPRDFFDNHFKNPHDAVKASHFGKVNWNDKYIYFNSYGNLETCDKIPYEDYSDEIINRFIVERI